jgi:hypothetical protein
MQKPNRTMLRVPSIAVSKVHELWEIVSKPYTTPTLRKSTRV